MDNSINSDVLLSRLRNMAAQAAAQPAAPVAVAKPDQAFGTVMRNALASVNQRQMDSSALTASFERGDEGVDLSRVMIEMQKARISFEALTQVRNRFVSAYQEVMSMPL